MTCPSSLGWLARKRTMVGLIGSAGDQIRFATSIFALTISISSQAQ